MLGQVFLALGFQNMKPKPQAPGPSPAHLGRAQARAVAEKSLVFGESMEVSVVTGSTCVPGTVINVDKFRRELPGGPLSHHYL